MKIESKDGTTILQLEGTELDTIWSALEKLETDMDIEEESYEQAVKLQKQLRAFFPPNTDEFKQAISKEIVRVESAHAEMAANNGWTYTPLTTKQKYAIIADVTAELYERTYEGCIRDSPTGL